MNDGDAPAFDGPLPDCQSRTRRGVLAAGVAVLLTGCLGRRERGASDTDAETPRQAERSATPTASPALASVLVDVARASDPESVADARGLRTRDGRVLVVVELRTGRTLPTEPSVDVTGRRDDAVFGYVAYEELTSLAAHENVSAVRPPNEVSS